MDYFETDVRPGEIVTGLVVPPAPDGAGTAYLKFLPRTADDYATVSVAAVANPRRRGQLRRHTHRAGVGGTDAHPGHRLRRTTLRGQPLTDEAIREAAATVQDAVDPLDDHRGSAEYKREMAEVFTRRAVRQAMTNAGMVVAS